MLIFLTLVGTIYAIFIFLVIGSAALRVLGNKHPALPHGYTLALGCAILVLASYSLGYVGLRGLVGLLVGVAIAWWVVTQQWRHVRSSSSAYDPRAILLIALFSSLFTLFNAFSGITTDAGFEMRGTNSVDGFVHLSYAKNLITTFPPTRPVFAEMPLTGYHYFFPLLVAQLYLLTGIPVETLMFRVLPCVLAALYGLSFYALSTLLTKRKSLHYLSILCAYTTYSTLPLIPGFFVGFPAIQNPLSLVHNPSTLMAMAFINAAIYALVKLNEEKKWGWAISAGLLIGVLPQTKIYAGMIGLGMITTYTGIKLITGFIKRKNGHGQSTVSGKNWLMLGSAFSIAVALTYLTFFITNTGSGSLVVAPFRVFDHFMEQETFVSLQWPQRKAIFLADNNYLRIILLYAQALGIFFLIHLGTRIFALPLITHFFKKSFWQKDTNLLIALAIFFSFAIPSLVIQSVSVFDITQTFWFGTALLAIPSAFGIMHLIDKAPRGLLKNSVTVGIIIAAVVPFTLAYRAESRVYLTGQPDLIVPHTQRAVFKHIEQTILPSEFLFLIPEFQRNLDQSYSIQWARAPIIPGLTGRSLYFEQSGTPFQSSPEVEKRKALINRAVDATYRCNIEDIRSILREAGTRYLVTVKPYSCFTRPDFAATFTESETFSFYTLTGMQ